MVILCPWATLAQQPAAVKDTPKEQVAPPASSLNRVAVTSNGRPVPFATILNTRTGHATVADVNGVGAVPAWRGNDTLKVQSLGYEVVTVIPGREPLEVIELAPTTFEIEEVVVQSNAMASSALTSSALVQMDGLVAKAPVMTVETTAELLESSGQVHMQVSQQGGISPVLRGFEASRVLLVVDGVRMNNAIYRSGHLQNASTVDPFAVAQTQVIMGPSSVLYGSDALGGVVHFLTPKPECSRNGFEVQGRVVGQGSTVNQGWAGHLNVEMKGKKWANLTNFTRREFGDLRMGSWRTHGDSTWGLVPSLVQQVGGRDTLIDNPDPEVQVPTGYDQWDLQHRMFVSTPISQFDVNFQHSTTSDVPRFDVFNDMVGDQPKWAEWSYGPQRRSMLSLSSLSSLWGNVFWTTTASYQHVEESRIKRRFEGLQRVTQKEALDVWGLSSVMRGRKNQVGWEAGLDGQWNTVSSVAQSVHVQTGATSPDWTRYADGGSAMSTWGGFASARRTWGRHTFRGGVRYSQASVEASFEDTTWLELPEREVQQSGGAWTGSASWEGSLAPNLQALTSLSSGFRHPNVDDLGKVREKNGFVLVPNGDLDPEHLYAAEQSLKWNLKPHSDMLSIQLAAFGSLWKDAIVQANASLGGDTMLVVDGDSARIQMNQNLDRAWVRGARFEIGGRLWPKTMFRGVLNWTLGTSLDETRSPLAHIPPTFGLVEISKKGTTGRLTSSVRFALPKLAADFGPGPTDNLQEALPWGTPGWATWNVEGSLRLTSSLELRVSALNLLDQHYRTFGSGLSAPGRNVRGTLTARF